MSNVSIKQADCPKTVVIELSEAAARRLQAALESSGAFYSPDDEIASELLDTSIALDDEGIASEGFFIDGEFTYDTAAAEDHG